MGPEGPSLSRICEKVAKQALFLLRWSWVLKDYEGNHEVKRATRPITEKATQLTRIHISLYLFSWGVGSANHEDPVRVILFSAFSIASATLKLLSFMLTQKKTPFRMSNFQLDISYSGVLPEFLTSGMDSCPSLDSQYTRSTYALAWHCFLRAPSDVKQQCIRVALLWHGFLKVSSDLICSAVRVTPCCMMNSVIDFTAKLGIAFGGVFLCVSVSVGKQNRVSKPCGN